MFSFWKKIKNKKKEKKFKKKNKKHLIETKDFNDVENNENIINELVANEDVTNNINEELNEKENLKTINVTNQSENQEINDSKEMLSDKVIEIKDTSDLTFSQEEIIEKNLFYDTLYTEQELKELNLTDNEVIKFFKNGSTYYKLKEPLKNEDNPKRIFKNNTKFSLKTLGEFVERDPYFSDVKHYKKFDFEGILAIDKDIDPKIHEKIFELNKTLEKQLKDIESYNLDENELDSIAEAQKSILENQKQMQKMIYNLTDDFTNSDVIYRVQNIDFNTWNEDDIYFGYKLNKINFDIYKGDRIVILSENFISNQLLIDVLRGDEIKTSGYVYKNVSRSQKWIDVDEDSFDENVSDFNEIIFNGLMSPDYLSFGYRKRDTVATLMQKVFVALKVNVDEEFKYNLIRLMKFDDFLRKNVFELDDLNLEKFITICDILIGKKILLIKSICQGMAHNDKIELLNFLNRYFDKKRITVLYASDDFLEANIVANKIMILKDGFIVDFKNVDNVLKTHNTINDFILKTIKYGVVPEMDE